MKSPTSPTTKSSLTNPSAISWKIFSWIYALIVLIDIIVLSVPGWHKAREISKPLIVASLMAFFLINRFPIRNKKDRLLFLALLFSFLGDGFLNYEGYFLQGLFSFFIAHVFYILTFLNGAGIRTNFNYRAFILLIVYALVVYLFIANDLGAMKPYVILYMAVLIFMVVSVMSTKFQVPAFSYRSGIAGAVLFLLSDSLLAINKFSQTLWMGPQMVILTYSLAQFFILRSYLMALSNRANNDEKSL